MFDDVKLVTKIGKGVLAEKENLCVEKNNKVWSGNSLKDEINNHHDDNIDKYL